MDRRIFLLSSLAVAGCGVAHDGQVAICDAPLALRLARALAHEDRSPVILPQGSPQALLDAAEPVRSALVVTRYSLIANRLQRLGYVRLEHRWQARIAGEIVQILVTRGGGPDQWRALKLAKWLTSDDAARLLERPTAP